MTWPSGDNWPKLESTTPLRSMFPALPRLLPRACRGFTSRAAVLNEFPPAYSVKPYPRPAQRGPYNGLVIPPPTRDTWDDHPISDKIVEPTTPAAEKWRAQSRYTVPLLLKHRPADAYQGRSVQVGARSFGEAAAELDRILNNNRVRYTLFKTERHEKKGERRRRIKSEQWRKHFANQVRKNVQLVRKIRQRGV
ncbi:hypothetical protein C8R44DRAFT_743623 [Mycena epipterygia]|nr:hypothetical protein C8R44DRAFT_743623 [Mycena epipterygia]